MLRPSCSLSLLEGEAQQRNTTGGNNKTVAAFSPYLYSPIFNHHFIQPISSSLAQLLHHRYWSSSIKAVSCMYAAGVAGVIQLILISTKSCSENVIRLKKLILKSHATKHVFEWLLVFYRFFLHTSSPSMLSLF